RECPPLRAARPLRGELERADELLVCPNRGLSWPFAGPRASDVQRERRRREAVELLAFEEIVDAALRDAGELHDVGHADAGTMRLRNQRRQLLGSLALRF